MDKCLQNHVSIQDAGKSIKKPYLLKRKLNLIGKCLQNHVLLQDAGQLHVLDGSEILHDHTVIISQGPLLMLDVMSSDVKTVICIANQISSLLSANRDLKDEIPLDVAQYDSCPWLLLAR